ncbi:hypothetical protein CAUPRSCDRAFT_11320 [Caulochytrium protostelioides]|uniref:Uncharacterized protein n=1 Tax=Caulochytrium protostelioides TaxID=1555241 RepID=A0A4P9X022_9FUNG|nr:hypothetical protein CAUPRSCDRAFT_11320 [Caulochytrium protostelioides]
MPANPHGSPAPQPGRTTLEPPGPHQPGPLCHDRRPSADCYATIWPKLQPSRLRARNWTSLRWAHCDTASQCYARVRTGSFTPVHQLRALGALPYSMPDRCLLCDDEDDTLPHALLGCKALTGARQACGLLPSPIPPASPPSSDPWTLMGDALRGAEWANTTPRPAPTPPTAIAGASDNPADIQSPHDTNIPEPFPPYTTNSERLVLTWATFLERVQRRRAARIRQIQREFHMVILPRQRRRYAH